MVNLKIAPPGRSVRKVQEKDLLFNAAKNLFRVLSDPQREHFGILEHSIDNHPTPTTSATLKEVKHGLGFKPRVVAFYEFDDPDASYIKTGFLPGPFDFGVSIGHRWDAYVDEQVFRINYTRLFNADISGSHMRIKWFILAQPAIVD